MTTEPEPRKTRQPFEDDCPHCGEQAEALTDTGRPNLANNGDHARCSGCHLPGVVVVDEEPHAYIDWHDDPGCDCDWCKAHPNE